MLQTKSYSGIGRCKSSNSIGASKRVSASDVSFIFFADETLAAPPNTRNDRSVPKKQISPDRLLRAC